MSADEKQVREQELNQTWASAEDPETKQTPQPSMSVTKTKEHICSKS